MKRLKTSGTFLNRRHSAWTRWPLGLLAWAFTLVVTFEPTLAGEIIRRVIVQDEFHRAARRASFYARRGWPRLNLSRDMVYVFCHQMGMAELVAMRRFLERRQAAFAPGLVACDLAYVSAMMAIETAADPQSAAAVRPALEVFRADADRVLAAIRQTPFDAPSLPPEKDHSLFALDQAAEALADFSAQMQALGHRWFVLSGTLLGVVREGGFLAHDYDIDAGVIADEVDALALRKALQAHGPFRCSALEWLTVMAPGVDGPAVQRMPVFMKLSHRNGVYIDIFIHYHEGETLWHASSLFRWDNRRFDLAPYTLAGVEVLGPADADLYLTENYGNWRVPVTEFNSALDTTNQSVVRNPLSVAIFLRRIWMAQRSNPKGAEALMRALVRGGFVRADGEGAWRADLAAFVGEGPRQA